MGLVSRGLMMCDSDWVKTTRIAYAAERSVALLFDYDGTLTPIVEHPDRAILTDSVRNLLQELTSIERVFVGVISGRALADVSEKVGLAGVYYAGSGGAELDLRGVPLKYSLDAATRRQLKISQVQLQKAIRDFPGVWVEPKPVGFAVHHRAASPTTATAFCDVLPRLLSRFRLLRCLKVCAAYEVSPVDCWDKGTAVEMILARLPPNVFSIYVGDSENDRPGMAVVRETGGLTVGIGAFAPSCAIQRYNSPAELHGALLRLCVSFSESVLRRR
jgi:trehalose 6-phosphate phosphatase